MTEGTASTTQGRLKGCMPRDQSAIPWQPLVTRKNVYFPTNCRVFAEGCWVLGKNIHKEGAELKISA